MEARCGEVSCGCDDDSRCSDDDDDDDGDFGDDNWQWRVILIAVGMVSTHCT